MSVKLPPGAAGIIVAQLAEMVPAPREVTVFPAFLALASALFGRRIKDGQESTNLFLLTAAQTLAGKSRMMRALGAALYNAQVGWDASPDDPAALVATHGTAGRSLLFDAPWRTATRLHSELLRTGSQCFIADDFKPTARFIDDDSDLQAYLSHAWSAGTASASLAQLDRRAGNFGDGSGAAAVWNPSVTIWAACTPQELPDVGNAFWDRWLICVDDAAPQAAPELRNLRECRAAFSSDVADLLRQWIIEARQLDDAYAAAAVADPDDERPAVTPLQALATIQRTQLRSVFWNAAAIEVADGVPGRARTLARRVACLVTAVNGLQIVDEETARWAADFVTRHAALRMLPVAREVFKAAQAFIRTSPRREAVAAAATAKLKAQGYVRPGPLVARALETLQSEGTLDADARLTTQQPRAI